MRELFGLGLDVNPIHIGGPIQSKGGDSYWALQGSHRLKWRQKGSQKAEDVNDNRGFQTAWIAMPMEAWEERDREGLVGRIRMREREPRLRVVEGSKQVQRNIIIALSEVPHTLL